MTARSTMVHRAVVTRAPEMGVDSDGHPVRVPRKVINSSMPCYLWSNYSTEKLDGTHEVVNERLKLMFPSKADLHEDDVITSITDRAGGSIIDTPVQIRGIQWRYGHREAFVERWYG